MSEPRPPRDITFSSVEAIVADVERLRRGHIAVGHWTMPMICYHLNLAPANYVRPPANQVPTPEQAAGQRRIDQLMGAGKMPHGLPVAPGTEPPTTAGEDSIDALINSLRTLARYTESHVDFGPFGPMESAKFKRFICIHSANHLDFLWPRVERRSTLHFADTNAVKAEVEKLKRDYAIAGAWTLPQVCYHLDKIMASSMNPGPYPPDTAEMIARRPILVTVLASGEVPDGLVSPPEMAPPAHAPESAVDDFLATLDRFAAYPGPFAPHRLFGTMSGADRRRHQMIHCAHHLAYLVPAAPSAI